VTGGVREESGLRRPAGGAGDAQAEVLSIPRGGTGGIGMLKGDVFNDHVCSQYQIAAPVNAENLTTFFSSTNYTNFTN
jgi:hypothetical protein